MRWAAGKRSGEGSGGGSYPTTITAPACGQAPLCPLGCPRGHPWLTAMTGPFLTASSGAKAKFTGSPADPSSLGRRSRRTRAFSSDGRQDLPLCCQGRHTWSRRGVRLRGSDGGRNTDPAARILLCQEQRRGAKKSQSELAASESDPGVGFRVIRDYSKYIAAIRFHRLLPRLPRPPSPEKEQPKEKNEANGKIHRLPVPRQHEHQWQRPHIQYPNLINK